MAEPKRGSVEAFKAAEKRRQERLKKPSLKKTDAKKEAFNKKVASINKSRINQDSVSKFKAAEERRKARVASVNKINPNSPKAKRIAAKRAEADVEKDLPKSKINTTAATTVGTAAGKIASQAKKVSTKTKTLPKAKPDLKGAASSFGEAFKKARAQGVGTKFAYNDKMYSAVTKDDISRAGKSSLQDFLNSAKRKETQIAKAPGQIVKKQSGGMIAQTPQGRMPQISKEKRDRIRNMIASARAGSETIREGGMKEDRLKTRLKARADEAKERNVRLKERSGAAVSDREMKSIMEQMSRSAVEDRFKTGGSVMARGCKLGRKKPTKMY